MKKAFFLGVMGLSFIVGTSFVEGQKWLKQEEQAEMLQNEEDAQEE